jgi:uncharacterized membrane protein YdjX (TVP38/TMEM64 family)
MNRSLIIKLGFAVIWLLLFYGLLFDSTMSKSLFHLCTEHPVLAPFILILAQVVLASFALPCSPLSMLAGILWGFYWGILFSTLATIAASLWTFFLGRAVLKRWTANWWNKIAALTARYNWKASMMAHANPIFPGSSLGYAFGAAGMSVNSFLLGVILGTIPLQIITVALGSAASDIANRSAYGSLLWFLFLLALMALYKILSPIVFDEKER